MTKRLSPTFIELTQDTLLKVFWLKQSLRYFLQQHGIENSMLAQWYQDQTKRDFVVWLWSQLVKSEDGHQTILDMARSMAEMEYFPDLERKEDSNIRISVAKQAITRLKEQVLRINDTIRETKEATQRRKASQEAISKQLAAQQSLEKLQKQLVDLMPRLGTQEGGYAFERWFYDLAVFHELESRPGYKTDGRQIDGAITMEGTTFLIETKFTQEPVGSPDIDTFMAKIESKADNTMGLFVSISGFNEGSKRAASKQRTPMLLLDYDHIFNLILRGVMSLPEVVSRIKRNASQTGSAYLPAMGF